MPSYIFEMSYIGSDFHGWQSQVSGTSIQDHLNKVLLTLLKQPVKSVGASRTDSGVHAERQLAMVTTSLPVEISHTLLKSVNALLPDSVGVSSIRPAEEGFHPIYSSVGKAYCYRIWRDVTANPFIRPYCWQYTKDMNMDTFCQNAKLLIGQHDFSAFCAADSSAKTRVRRIIDIKVIEKGALLEFWISGEGFLKQMIRIMVGTLVKLAVENPPVTILDILATGSRKLAGKTAPAHGLTLIEIFYDQIQELDDIITRRKDSFNFAL